MLGVLFSGEGRLLLENFSFSIGFLVRVEDLLAFS